MTAREPDEQRPSSASDEAQNAGRPDGPAALYSEYHELLWEALPVGLDPPRMRERLAFLAERIEAGQRVLDVGCGEGQIATALRVAGRVVVGIDVAREPLRRARARDPELDLRLVAPGGPWPLLDNEFEAVWIGETLEHVLDVAGLLSEARRVLRSDGLLLISTPEHGPLARLSVGLLRRAFEAHFEPRSDHIRFFTRAGLRGLLEEFGFQTIESQGIGGWPGARETLLASARRTRFWRAP